MGSNHSPCFILHRNSFLMIYCITFNFLRKKHGSFNMIMTFRHTEMHIIKHRFVLFLSGPSRFKNLEMPGRSNSEVGDEKDQKSLGKLLFSTILVSKEL